MLKPLFLLVVIASTALSSAEESCTTPDGETSTCVLLEDCPRLLELTWSKKHEDRSFFLNSRCNNNEATKPIAKPSEVTLTERIAENLMIGSRIIVTGTPSSDFPQIEINIGNGVDDEHIGNISLHYSIRLSEQIVVRNTMIRNEWTSEENSCCRPFPFRKGKPFVMDILFGATQALCAVDGVHYFNYNYRNPSPLTSNWVQVKGLKDAVMNIILRPDWWKNSISRAAEDPLPEVRYKLFVQKYQAELKVGTIITCSGTAPDESSWFSIGAGSSGIIHESFKVDMSKQSIIHSTKYNEEWGPDDSAPNKVFPFEANQRFELQMKISVNEIEVLVNGQHYRTYTDSRFFLYNMDQVFITGLKDASLTVYHPDQDLKTVSDKQKVCCPPTKITADVDDAPYWHVNMDGMEYLALN